MVLRCVCLQSGTNQLFKRFQEVDSRCKKPYYYSDIHLLICGFSKESTLAVINKTIICLPH